MRQSSAGERQNWQLMLKLIVAIVTLDTLALSLRWEKLVIPMYGLLQHLGYDSQIFIYLDTHL